MPIDEAILGFSNRWYKAAIKDAFDVALPGVLLYVLSALPIFWRLSLKRLQAEAMEIISAMIWKILFLLWKTGIDLSSN